MDACILQKKIPQHYKIKQEDKHPPTHTFAQMHISLQKKAAYLQPPSIYNAGNQLSHMIIDITFQATVINQQVAE